MIQTKLVCQPCLKKNSWTKLMFRSETNHGIPGLVVTLKCNNMEPITKTTDSEGLVSFDKIPCDIASFTVTTESLLREVEKYPSIKAEPNFTPHNEIEVSGVEPDCILHRKVNLGDLWDDEPEDKIIVQMHPRISKAIANSVCPTHLTVFEVSSLRCQLPIFLEANEYNLVSGYNGSLFAMLAYADYFNGIITESESKYNVTTIKPANFALLPAVESTLEEKAQTSRDDGSVLGVLTTLRKNEYVKKLKIYDLVTPPNIVSNKLATFITKEAKYSEHLKGLPVIESTPKQMIDSAESFICWNDDTIIVSFRGTQEMLYDGLITDLNTIKKSIALDGDPDSTNKKFSVHAGFCNYVDNLYPLLKFKLQQLLSEKSRHLIICGHSLGGASATLFSLYAKNLKGIGDKVKSQHTFTYGSPRVFSDSEKLWPHIEKLVHFRHVNYKDLVPIIPPQFLGFIHQGQLVQMFDYRQTNYVTKQVLLLPEINIDPTCDHHDSDKDGKCDSCASDDGFVDLTLNVKKLIGVDYHWGDRYALNLVNHIADFYTHDISVQQRKTIVINDLTTELDSLRSKSLYKRNWKPSFHAKETLPIVYDQAELLYKVEMLKNSISMLERQSVSSTIIKNLGSDSILYAGTKPDQELKDQLKNWRPIND